MNKCRHFTKQPANRFRLFLLVITVLLILSGEDFLYAATVPSGFTDSVFVSGLSNPTAMAFAPDGRLFVCQQGGSLRVVKNGALLSTPFVSLTVDSSGERGLLGIAFDPNFASNQFVYVYYTATTPAAHNRISRFTANGDVAVPGSESVVLDLNNLSGATNHNGGAIHFGADGKLYAAVGENANGANAQNLTNLLGKMLRINADGSIPTDNPFFNNQTAEIRKEIWAFGLRNPFTFSFQPGTNRMFINDVGQNTWEEINDGIAGSNYGWSICEGNCSPSNANYRDPIFKYANDASTCAITGGAFYNPQITQFPADYVGDYFFADYCGGWIKKIDPANGNLLANFATGISSPVDLQVSSDGSLYYLARGTGTNTGAVGRIRYSLGTTAAAVSVSGRVMTTSGSGISSVMILMTDSNGNVRTTVTDASGYYNFTDVPAGDTYIVTARGKRYTFAQPSQVLSVSDDATEVNFIGSSGKRAKIF